MIKVLLIAFFISNSWAYQSSLNENSNPLRWGNPSAVISNSSTSEGLTRDQIEASLIYSINQWNNTHAFQITQINSSSNNVIKFDQNFSYGSGIVAITEVSYGASGVINSANIILNDRDFDFTDDASNPSKIYLPAILTHELGHFMGLSHSEVLDASMFYTFFRGQESLSSDDISGLRTKYKKSKFGRIYGYVKGGNQIGILGVHVQAISAKTGDIISTISDEKGFFEISGLNLNDNYYLYTSPLKNLASLPVYFSNSQEKFCPGAYTGGFFSACGSDHEGIAQPIMLKSESSELNVGVVSINCGLKNQLDYQLEKVKPVTSRERILIFDSNNAQETQKAYVGHINPNEIESNGFKKVDKFLIDLSGIPTGLKAKIQLISKKFGNPLSYSLDISSPLSSVSLTSLLNPDSIDISHWLTLSQNSNENIFEIDLSAKSISTLMTSIIPSSSIFTTTAPWPYLIVISLWEETPEGEIIPASSESYLSDNKSCLDAPYTVSVEKSEFSNATSNNDLAASSTAGASCGTIDPPDEGPKNSMPLMMLGFMISLLIIPLSKKAKNFLS